MDDEEDLLNIDLDTSPSFDVSNSLQVATTKKPSSPLQNTNGAAAKPPSAADASKLSQQQRDLENPRWLQGTNREISQRELIERQRQAKMRAEVGEAAGTQGGTIPQQMGQQGEEDYDNRLTIRDRVRKTAVAVTGSAIVASGTVMLFTPLHPLGHPIQAGGLGVLATEFEGPKKAYNKSKEMAKRLTGKSERTQEASNQNGQSREPLGPNPLQNTSELQRSFASSSYVSPFRKQSIPNNNAESPPKPKAAKPSVPKSTLKRQGSTSLSSVEGINNNAQPPPKAKAAKPSVPKSTLKRQGSTSLSGGI
mmetsp:Transcript_18983/g.47026  ORF Transcript_18983/g.47026 Transcript_18983/m.47026 type:complete len:308 (+) Transcript_18983:481-1404(+)